jgi:hypothetical protein
MFLRWLSLAFAAERELLAGTAAPVDGTMTDWTTDHWRVEHPDVGYFFFQFHQTYCPKRNIKVADNKDPAIAAEACVNKCGGTEAERLAKRRACKEDPNANECIFCDDNLETYPDDAAICAYADTCMDICGDMADCHSIDITSAAGPFPRCYLNTIECKGEMNDQKNQAKNFPADHNYHLLLKVYYDLPSCGLGWGAEILGGPDPYGVSGLYGAPKSGPTDVYTKVGGGAQISWHTSGCGWVVEKEISSRRLSSCEDNPAAASAAFGLPETDTEFCAGAAYASKYCSNAVFAALCPATCGASCEESQEAGEELASLLGLEGDCKKISAACGSPVVSAVCKQTCSKSRRKGNKAFPALAQNFRASLKTLDARRLGINVEEGFYEILYSFQPIGFDGETFVDSMPNCAGSDLNIAPPENKTESLTSALYDVYALHQPFATEKWGHTCKSLEAYNTYSHYYCVGNNLDATDPAYAQELCDAKCNDAGDIAGATGAAGFCSGAPSADESEHVKAVCLSRTKCEELCSAVTGCTSFDMHQTLPRCYLNTDFCLSGVHDALTGSATEGLMMSERKAKMPGMGADDMPLLGVLPVHKEGPEHSREIFDMGDYDFVYFGDAKAKYETHDGMACNVAPMSVQDVSTVCYRRCGYPDFNAKAIHNGRVHADFATAYPSTEGFTPNSAHAIFVGDFIVTTQYGEIALGRVNEADQEVYFNTAVPLPFRPGTNATRFGATLVTLDHEALEFAVVAAVPATGVLVVKGKIDPVTYKLHFDDAIAVEDDYGEIFGAEASGLSLRGAVAGDSDHLVLSVAVRDNYIWCVDSGAIGNGTVGNVFTAECTANFTRDYAIDLYAVAVKISTKETGATHIITKTNETEDALPSCAYSYYYYSSYSYSDSRRLSEDRELLGGVVFLGASGEGHWYSDYLSSIEIASAVVMTENQLVHVAMGDKIRFYRHKVEDDDDSCLFQKPKQVDMSCPQGSAAAIPGTDNILVICGAAAKADVKAIICHMAGEEIECGEQYAYATTATVGEVGTVQVTCTSSENCIGLTAARDFHFLGIEGLNVTWFEEENKLVTKLASGVTATPDAKPGGFVKATLAFNANKDQLFVAATLMFNETLKTIPVFAPAGVADINTSLSGTYPFSTGDHAEVSDGYIYGILLKDIGSTFEHLGEPECSYFMSNTSLAKENSICGGRSTCEETCTETSGCTAFEYEPGSNACKLYSTCPKVTSTGTTVVEKKATGSCKIDVTGSSVPKSIERSCMKSYPKDWCEVDGTYTPLSDSAYVSEKNTTKIYMHAGEECLGWVMGMNTAPKEEIHAVTWKDADKKEFDEYMAKLKEVMTGAGTWTAKMDKLPPDGCANICKDIGNCVVDNPPPAPDDWEAPPDWDCNNDLLKALCPATCSPLKQEKLAGVMTSYNDLYATKEDIPEADVGAALYMELYGSANTSTCETLCVCGGKKGPCSDKKTLLFLCPKSCQRRPDRTYTSTVLDWIPTDHDDFYDYAKTFANGSAQVHDLDDMGFVTGGTVKDLGYGQCPPTPYFGFKSFLVDPSLMKGANIYPAVTEQSSMNMKTVCADKTFCPGLTTCVVTSERHDAELGMLLADYVFSDYWAIAPWTLPADEQAALIESDAWQDFALYPDLSNNDILFKFPKVISSEYRTDALIRVDKWDFGKDISRPVPGATRVRMIEVGKAATVWVTLSSAVDWAAKMTLGRTYETLKGLGPLVTDVVRVSGWDKDKNPMHTVPNDFVMDLYYPYATDIVVIVYERGGGTAPISAENIVIGPEKTGAHMADGLQKGWFRITVPGQYWNADFAVAIDKDECALGISGCEAPEDGGHCTNTAMSSPEWSAFGGKTGYKGAYFCSCLAGYKPVLRGVVQHAYTTGDPLPSPATQCAMTSYNAADSMFVFYHVDAAKFGVKLAEVGIFATGTEEEGCTGDAYNEKDTYKTADGGVKKIMEEVSKTMRVSGIYGDTPWGIDQDSHLPQEGPAVSRGVGKLLQGKPGEYAAYNGDLLTDLDSSTIWQSDKLEHDRSAGTGAWVSFTVPSGVTVGCVRVEFPVCGIDQDEYFPSEPYIADSQSGLPVRPAASVKAGKTNVGPHYDEKAKMPLTYTLARGTAGLATPGPGWAASGSPELSKPWLQKITKDRMATQTKLDFPMSCGTTSRQWFGEIMLEFKSTKDNILTPCSCKQLCLDQVDEGCVSWKFYYDDSAGKSVPDHGIGHCFLHRTYFSGTDEESVVEDPDTALAYPRASNRPHDMLEAGSGWWKLPYADNWPGWWAGDTGPIAFGFETTPATVVVGEPFTLKLTGVGFPLDEAMVNNLGARQRMKIVEKEAACATAVPPEFVEGIGCTNAVTCSSRPVSFSRRMATWKNLVFSSKVESQEYKVCWCAGHCYDVENWIEVEGEMKVDASPYSWMLEHLTNPIPPEKVDGRLALRISRPAFSSVTNQSEWRIKLVEEGMSCTQSIGGRYIGCYATDATGCPPTETTFLVDHPDSFNPNLGPDAATFMLEPGKEAVQPGFYQVCFSDGGAFLPIPSAASRFLEVKKADWDPSHPRGPFHHQSFSAKANADVDIGVAGYRMYLPNSNKVAIVDSATDNCQVANALTDVLIILDADAGASTVEEYRFSGKVPPIGAGTYSLCMCEDLSYTPSATSINITEVFAASAGFPSEDLCVVKCAPGCVGSTCFCDGLDDADEGKFGTTTSGPLCLDSAGCRAACDATEGCGGYNMHATLNRCFLDPGNATLASPADPAYESFTYDEAAADCSAGNNFATEDADSPMVTKNHLGTVYVTTKADVGASYVVTPGEYSSIEITGSDFEAGDRVMVIDCFGTCGVTEASESVFPDVPVTGRMPFAEWAPILPTLDRPSQTPSMADPGTFSSDPYWTYLEPSVPAPVSYASTANSYCAGNLPVVPNTLAESQTCKSKCMDKKCTGPSCFCDGFVPGFDDVEDTGAMCLDEEQCKWLCAADENCFAIDMAEGKNRCFLNSYSCALDVQNGKVEKDAGYTLLTKTLDNNARRLSQELLKPATVRKLVSRRAQDAGISYDNKFRYKDIMFANGGEFKLCFCDATLTDGVCDDPSEFTIEVGKVHATGLQCLLSNPKMTKGTCVEQMYGGLRCYSGETPDEDVPTALTGVPNPDVGARSELMSNIIAFCQLAPISDLKVSADVYEYCSQYRKYDEASPLPNGGPIR